VGFLYAHLPSIRVSREPRNDVRRVEDIHVKGMSTTLTINL